MKGSSSFSPVAKTRFDDFASLLLSSLSLSYADSVFTSSHSVVLVVFSFLFFLSSSLYLPGLCSTNYIGGFSFLVLHIILFYWHANLEQGLIYHAMCRPIYPSS